VKLRLRFSEKAAKNFEDISLLVLMLLIIRYVKTKREISSNFVAFSEYMNFKSLVCLLNNFSEYSKQNESFFGFLPGG